MNDSEPSVGSHSSANGFVYINSCTRMHSQITIIPMEFYQTHTIASTQTSQSRQSVEQITILKFVDDETSKSLKQLQVEKSLRCNIYKW